MAHAPIETKVTEEWVRTQEDTEDGILSVGGLAHRVGMLGSSASSEPSRLTLAKFIELARPKGINRRRNGARRRWRGTGDIVALEKPDWPSPRHQVIESVARALGVDALPLLELGGFNRSGSKELGNIAVQFAARLEPVTPLEAHELEALSWLRNHAFRSSAKTGQNWLNPTSRFVEDMALAAPSNAALPCLSSSRSWSACICMRLQEP